MDLDIFTFSDWNLAIIALKLIFLWIIISLKVTELHAFYIVPKCIRNTEFEINDNSMMTRLTKIIAKIIMFKMDIMNFW